MKNICLILLIINISLLAYWPIKKYTLMSYADQYSKLDFTTKLNYYKFTLERYFYVRQASAARIFNLNFIKSLLKLKINSPQHNSVDSIINEYLKQLSILDPNNNKVINIPSFNLKNFPTEFIPILNNLSILTIGEFAFNQSASTGEHGLDRIKIIKIPNGHSIKKYSIFCTEGSYYNDDESTYLLIGKDTISDQLTNIYKLSSPIDSTTLIYKYVKLYGEKDSLISTYKTKIIELD